MWRSFRILAFEIWFVYAVPLAKTQSKDKPIITTPLVLIQFLHATWAPNKWQHWKARRKEAPHGDVCDAEGHAEESLGKTPDVIETINPLDAKVHELTDIHLTEDEIKTFEAELDEASALTAHVATNDTTAVADDDPVAHSCTHDSFFFWQCR